MTAAPSPPPAPPPSAADRLRDRDRRERIATAVLAGGVAHPESAGGVNCVKWAIDLADMLIKELDKEGGR